MELFELRGKLKENLILLNHELEKVEQGIQHQVQKIVLHVLARYEQTNGNDSLGVSLTFLKSEIYKASEDFTEKDIFEAVMGLVDENKIKDKYSIDHNDTYFSMPGSSR